MTQQCACEHWQICPTCSPNRFDAEGKMLPPPLTPLQACQAKLDALKEASKLMLEELETYHQQYPGMAKGYVLDAMRGLKEAIKGAEA